MWTNILKAEYKFPYHMYVALREMHYTDGIPLDAQPKEDLAFMLGEIVGVAEELSDKLSITRPQELFTQKGNNITLTDDGDRYIREILDKAVLGKNLHRGLGDIIILEY